MQKLENGYNRYLLSSGEIYELEKRDGNAYLLYRVYLPDDLCLTERRVFASTIFKRVSDYRRFLLYKEINYFEKK